MTRETQESITAWADETFGPSTSNMRIATRANEEMAELLRALSVDDASPDAAVEIADVVIILNRLATKLGVDIAAEVDRKMEINRQRQWQLDGSGHGRHVRNKDHDFVKTGDADSFRSIEDGHGCVVLGFCRRCRQAEGELTPTCPGGPS